MLKNRTLAMLKTHRVEFSSKWIKVDYCPTSCIREKQKNTV